MKSTGKHRATGAVPRTGAAAIMIGGLVAGTVATAGAATLGQEPSGTDATASAVKGTSAEASATDVQEQAASLASLRSSSLSELRDQVAADRSEARKAPEDAASVATVLSNSAFTGQTVEVEETVEVEVETAPAEQTTVQEAAPAEQAAPTQQAAPAQEAAPAPAPAAAPAPVGGDVVGIALQYVGYPYVLGGTPPSTFDCSSFTWWVYQQMGISIPRTVSGQKAAVTPVSNPQPGDLVFTSDFYHVGIYAGNGMVVEALNPSTGVTYGAPVYGGIWYGRING